MSDLICEPAMRSLECGTLGNHQARPSLAPYLRANAITQRAVKPSSAPYLAVKKGTAGHVIVPDVPTKGYVHTSSSTHIQTVPVDEKNLNQSSLKEAHYAKYRMRRTTILI